MLKDHYLANPGFQHIIDQMELISSIGRRRLMEQPLCNDRATLEETFSHIERVLGLIQQPQHQSAFDNLRHHLMQLHDLQGTAQRIQVHSYVDEVELFEIKNLAYICMGVRREAQVLGIDDILRLPDLSPLFALLDPDRTGMPNFYIYDSYHPELGPIRKELKACQTKLNALSNDPATGQSLAERIASLFDQQQQLQQQIIEHLSEQLWPHANNFQVALERLADTDILLAKATQALRWNLCRPSLSEGLIRYSALVNPRLKERNEALHLRYQPIDIELKSGVCFITGANMAGKTVLLKSIAISQLMAQYAMFVPAQEATITLFDDISACIGDEQNEMNGLSSFASEITHISNLLKRSKSQRILILIDEPARTTNPIEGKALVQSLASLLDKRNSFTVITTHYSQLHLPCRRLRVKGFSEDLADSVLTSDNINRCIDYSLTEDRSDEVPHEALRIAALLGCDDDLIAEAKHRLSTEY